MRIFKLLQDIEIIEKRAHDRGYRRAKKKYLKFWEKRESFLKKEKKAELERQQLSFLNRLKIAEKDMEKTNVRAKKMINDARLVNEKLGSLIVYFMNASTNFKNIKEYFLKRAGEDAAMVNKNEAEFLALQRNYENAQNEIKELLVRNGGIFDGKFIEYEGKEKESEN